MEKVINGKKRILTYDYLRGFAIILMVVGHSIIVYPVNINAIPWCNVVYKWIYTFHMPLLFFVSGCVYKFGDYKSYMSKKVNRILVPYIFFGLIIDILHSMGSSLVNKQSDFHNILPNLFLGRSNWFLFTILMIFITFPFINKIIKSNKGILVAALVIMICVPSFLFPKVFQLRNYIHYLPFFMIGVYAKSFFKKAHTRSFLLTTAAVCFVLHSIAFWITKDVGEPLFSLLNLKAVLMIACLSCIFLDYDQHVIRKSQLVEKPLSFVQECSVFSLQIYLFNGFWLVLGRTIFCSYLHLTSPLAIIILLTVFNLSISYLICKFILPKSNILNWLCGNGSLKLAKK